MADWPRIELKPFVVLEPAAWERPSSERYRDLKSDLESLGYEVELAHPIEQRSVEQLAKPIADVVVRLTGVVEDHAIDAIVAAVIAHVGKALPHWKRGRRETVIVAPDGETILRRVTLSEPEK